MDSSAFNLSATVKMTAAKITLLNGAVVAQCDAADGVKDGPSETLGRAASTPQHCFGKVQTRRVV